MTNYPSYDADIYSDDGIVHPYEHYRRLRDLRGAVWLTKQSVWAIPRYDDVVRALRNHAVFSSAHGVGLNEAINKNLPGTTLGSDPPLHDKLRKILMQPISPSALSAMRPEIQATANALIERLVDMRSFDAATDLAQHLPLTIVSQQVGLPEEGRQNMLAYAAATFDMIGPDNERARAGLGIIQQMREYTASMTRETLKPGSWAARLLDKVDAGEIEPQRFALMMRDYLGPSLDTTIFATGNLIYLFSRFPDQWDVLREQPNLIQSAINEAIRLESPIRGFTRYLLQDHEIDGVLLPKGSRALILYASANRDERKWDDPERFDIRRKTADHVGFGMGIHSCAGMNLAKLEIECLLNALLPRVRRFEAGEPVRAMNNSLRGLSSLPVTVHV